MQVLFIVLSFPFYHFVMLEFGIVGGGLFIGILLAYLLNHENGDLVSRFFFTIFLFFFTGGISELKCISTIKGGCISDLNH